MSGMSKVAAGLSAEGRKRTTKGYIEKGNTERRGERGKKEDRNRAERRGGQERD